MSSVTAVPLLPIQKGSVRRLWLAVLFVILLAVLLAWNGVRSFGLGDPQQKDGVAARIAYQIITPGSAEHPGRDNVVLLSYRGTLSDGTQFDASQQPGPMDLTSMIPGFSEAVTKVGKGGRIRVEIPPQLGYGSEARGDKIPANSTLHFDISVLDFVNREQWTEIQRQMQMQQMLQQQMGGGGAPGAGGPPMPEGVVPQP